MQAHASHSDATVIAPAVVPAEQLARVQLVKLKLQDEVKCEERRYVADMGNQLLELEDTLQVSALGVEDRDQQLEEARAAILAKQAELDGLRSHLDDTARFLMKCMGDVRARVVSVESIQEEGDDTEISVLPGAPQRLRMPSEPESVAHAI